MYNHCKPTRQRVFEFGYVDIFRGKTEIARKHARGAPINSYLQLCSGQYRRTTYLIEGIEQRITTEGCTHRVSLMKTPRRERASSG